MNKRTVKIGDIVLYTLMDRDKPELAGETRPAIVVRVWNTDTGGANLQVFMDGDGDDDYNDGVDVTPLLWATSVEQYDPARDGDNHNGTWVFPE